MLFRYAALTFNGHRIHYDYPYVTQEEGYPGLIVHGPLIATLLLDLLRRERPRARVAEFSFRAKRPLFSSDPFSVRGWPSPDGRSARLVAVNPEGSAAMVAEAVFAA
jgi:3-methylfumaryl-CoA hydratase